MKSIKKLIALIPAIVFCMYLFTACGGSSTADVGHYVISSLTVGDQVLKSKDLKEAGIDDIYIKLNADGTADIKLEENVIKGKWKNGEISYKEDGETSSVKYELNGDILSFEDSDVKFVFKRLPSSSDSDKASSKSASSGGDPLKGTWEGEDTNGSKCKFVFNGKGGVKFSRVLDESGTYVISGNKVTVSLSSGTDVRSYYFEVTGNTLKLTVPKDEFWVGFTLTKK